MKTIVADISNVKKVKDTAKLTGNVLEIWFVAKTIVNFTILPIIVAKNPQLVLFFLRKLFFHN